MFALGGFAVFCVFAVGSLALHVLLLSTWLASLVIPGLGSLPNVWLLLLHFRSAARYYGVVPCVASLVRGSAITT